MLHIVYILLYNFLIFPILFIVFHFLALFNSKYRQGISGRYKSLGEVSAFINSRQNALQPGILIHCASMGEFEHIKPLIRAFKHRHPGQNIVVMFFSPSGYENAKQLPEIDLIIYTPFDSWFSIRKLFKMLRPSALLIAKYDVWPNQIWLAKQMNISCFLINATLNPFSGRLHPLLNHFQKDIYGTFKHILTVSETDNSLYQKWISPSRITTTGDSKYDQVIFRSEESQKKQFIPCDILSGKKIFVAGSTWQEGEMKLIPAFKKIIPQISNFLMIICPHEPTEEHIQQLQGHLLPLSSCLYSQLESYQSEHIIIIDQIGLLANLYSVAQAAYVGGGFKQNVHNVLEPAAYGIPVLFGPVNHTSHEAQLLKKSGGGFEISSTQEIQSILKKIFFDEKYQARAGKAALTTIKQNCGATENILNIILKNSTADSSY